MDYVSLTKTNRLFWLGRYSERVLSTTQYMMYWYDSMIDNAAIDFKDYCSRVGIPSDYPDAEAFMHSYLFDKENSYSLRYAAEEMLGNGMVLRETISSKTLAYLQMAVNALELAKEDSAPGVELQWVVDDVMAFRGSCDDFIEEEFIRNIIKTGISIERLSLYLRLDYNLDALPKEMKKMLNRLKKSGLATNAGSMGMIDLYRVGDAKKPSEEELLESVENLVIVI
ncbi:MAG: alpha-E domain-containing protein [Lachnospiraceae bacterium]|nr:alpha-E domain-containing protein [Lachnospiraceae bacterium]